MVDLDIRKNERFFREMLPELATFQAACLCKTRAAAAEMLGKDAATVGRSISKLERLLGAQVVDHRETKRVELTDAGKALLKFAETIVALKAEFDGRLAFLQNGSDITVATTNYAWLTYAKELEAAYREIRRDGKLNPGKSFWQQDRVWEELEKAVLDGQADVGIYSYPPSRERKFPKGLSQINWIEEEYVFVVPTKLITKLKRNRLSISDLAEALPELPQVVHYRRELAFDRTRLIEDYLKKQRVLSRYRDDWLLGANTIDEVKHTLLAQGGISFLPWPTVAKEHKDRQLTAFPIHPPLRARTMKIVYRSHGGRGAMKDFLRAAGKISYSRKFPYDVVRKTQGPSRS